MAQSLTAPRRRLDRNTLQRIDIIIVHLRAFFTQHKICMCIVMYIILNVKY